MRLTLIAIAVLVVVGSAYAIIDKTYRNKFDLQQIEDKIKTEKVIKDAIKESIETNPDSDPSISLERLREHLRDW